jgi:hypothetical protein
VSVVVGILNVILIVGATVGITLVLLAYFDPPAPVGSLVYYLRPIAMFLRVKLMGLRDGRPKSRH